MRNRNGEEYRFVPVNGNAYTIEGDLKYWRYGSKADEALDWTDLGFADPSGGPFISLGMLIEGRKIVRIRADGPQLLLEVEPQAL